MTGTRRGDILGSRERSWLWLTAAATIAMRCWFIVAHRIDSDEPQHLHVAWAWTQGLVQYRDVFDNHLPLLHLLFAPLMPLAPESSGVFVFMRLAIAPFAVGCALLLYLFARPLFGIRTAAVAALTFSVVPVWLSKSAEFRNDTLWVFFWLAALVLLVRQGRPAHFWAGIALGLSLLASIKAVPLLAAHVLALAVQGRIDLNRSGFRLALGFTIPLLVVGAAMAALGAAQSMIYDTLLFNAAAPVSMARRSGGAIGFVIAGAAVTFFGRRAANRETWRVHLALFAAWYSILLLGFWPILTPRDFLPVIPLGTIAMALHWTARWRNAALAVPVFVCAIWSVLDVRLWRRADTSRQRFVDAVVALSDRRDYVADLKGEAVFRRRALPYIYEDVGRALTAKGLLQDSGPERIVTYGCCVAVRDSLHLPPRSRAFLNRHFISAGRLRVCGARVNGNQFEIAVPQTYALLARDPARVLLDGAPYRGPRQLAPGVHTLSNENGETMTILWWRAAKEPL